jgi:hypothetical protein
MPATIYTNALAERLLGHVLRGSSLITAAKEENVGTDTLARWLFSNRHGFADKFRHVGLLLLTIFSLPHAKPVRATN